MNTIMKEEISNPLPQLLKGTSSYKLVIPEKVEEKIRYLIRKFPSTEWSGVLFYSHQGSFENNDLVITCQDIYPMDLGSSGWTEFHMSEDVTAYIADNIDLFDCETGLVHSHHSFGAYFSGQDNIMLQQEGNDTNCFVSLVVDTKGTYVARITRKLHTKSEITINSIDKSYEFFGEGERKILSESPAGIKVIEKTVIEYFDLEVERHIPSNNLEYLDTRFDEIQKRKTSSKINSHFSSDNSDAFADYLNQKERREKHNVKDNEELDLFKEDPKKDTILTDTVLTKQYNEKIDDLMSFDWNPDPKEVHKAVVHILTCSMIVDPAKIDLKQWVNKHMVKVYRQIFGEGSLQEARGDKPVGAFTEWKEFIVQFVTDNFNYPTSLSPDEDDMIFSAFAEAVCNELLQYLVNDYVKAYYEEFSMYLL